MIGQTAMRHFRQPMVFAVIGIINTAVHGTILILLVDHARWPVTLAHILAFIVANLASYGMNSRFTFHMPMSWFAYVRFLLASLLAFGLTLAIAASAELFHLHYLVGFVLIIFFVPVLNYFVLKFWAFRKQVPHAAK